MHVCRAQADCTGLVNQVGTTSGVTFLSTISGILAPEEKQFFTVRLPQIFLQYSKLKIINYRAQCFLCKNIQFF